MLPLTRQEARIFHNPRLPEYLYVADSTLYPHSLGSPPMLILLAMAKRVGNIIIEHFRKGSLNGKIADCRWSLLFL
jgi:hypothetical protein